MLHNRWLQCRGVLSGGVVLTGGGWSQNAKEQIPTGNNRAPSYHTIRPDERKICFDFFETVPCFQSICDEVAYEIKASGCQRRLEIVELRLPL